MNAKSRFPAALPALLALSMTFFIAKTSFASATIETKPSGQMHSAWDRWNEGTGPFILLQGRELHHRHFQMQFLKENPDPYVQTALKNSRKWDSVLTVAATTLGASSVIAVTGYIKDNNGEQNLSNSTINKFWISTVAMGILAIIAASRQNHFFKQAQVLHNESYSLLLSPSINEGQWGALAQLTVPWNQKK